MVFSSAISLFFFVPIVFLLDRRLSNMDAKNTWLLLASLVFYSFGQVYYLPLLQLHILGRSAPSSVFSLFTHGFYSPLFQSSFRMKFFITL